MTKSKIPWQFCGIPVKTEFSDIPCFSRNWKTLLYETNSWQISGERSAYSHCL